MAPALLVAKIVEVCFFLPSRCFNAFFIQLSLGICPTLLFLSHADHRRELPTLALPPSYSQQPVDVKREGSKEEEEEGGIDFPLVLPKVERPCELTPKRGKFLSKFQLNSLHYK